MCLQELHLLGRGSKSQAQPCGCAEGPSDIVPACDQQYYVFWLASFEEIYWFRQSPRLTNAFAETELQRS